MRPSKKQFYEWTLPSKASYLGLLIGIIAIFLAIFFFVYTLINENEKSIENATYGMLKKLRIVDTTEYRISFGGTTAIYDGKRLKENDPPVFIYCKSNQTNVYEISINDNKLVISTRFYDLENKIVAEIIDNEWFLNDNYFKRNFDESALEVIDNYGIVVTQIIINENHIIINGIFKCGKEIYFGRNNLTYTLATYPEAIKSIEKQYGVSFLDAYLIEGRKLDRIFRYSGENWLGKRVD